MLDYASEPEGEKTNKGGNPESDEASGECAAGEQTLVLDENNNPIGSGELNESAKKAVERRGWEEDTPLSKLIDEGDEIDELMHEDYNEGSLEKMLVERTKGKRENSLEKYLVRIIKDYGEDSPEMVLLREILEYDKNEMFSYSNTDAESMKASYGHNLLMAFELFCKKEYEAMESRIEVIVRHCRERKELESEMEKIQYLIGELRSLAGRKKQEETTQDLPEKSKKMLDEYKEAQEEYREVHNRKPKPDSRKWIDPEKGNMISSDITPEEAERVRKLAEASEELMKETTNYDKK